MTATTQEPFAGVMLLSAANEVAHVEALEGFEARPWSMSGFEGFIVGGVQLGQRNDEAIVRLSGDTAQQSWRRIYALAQTVTRLDLQLTCELRSDINRRIARDTAKARSFARRHRTKATITTIRSTDGGCTTYLGKRQSEWYGRIYNKHAQTRLDEWKGCVRYEVELKHRRAMLGVRKLASARHERDGALGILSAFFSSRGVSLREFGDAEIQLCCSRNRTDVLKKLEWLRAQVRPSIDYLRARGALNEAIDALGLWTTN